LSSRFSQYNLTYYIHLSISYIGLFILVILNSFKYEKFLYQDFIIWSIFLIITILGIIAGIVPQRCLKLHRKNQSVTVNESMIFLGHHPTCGNFSSHVIKFGNDFFCGGCSGLVTGAIISVFSSILYLSIGRNILYNSPLLFWTGFSSVFIGLLQHKLSFNNRFLHFFLNLTFVLGPFFLLLGIDLQKGGFFPELYLLMLSIYWIITRITLSKIEHDKICSNCGLKCEIRRA
jgi:hypothetical protein